MTTKRQMESSSVQIRSSHKNQKTTVAPALTELAARLKKREKNPLSVTILIKLPLMLLKRTRMMRKRRDVVIRVSKNVALISPCSA